MSRALIVIHGPVSMRKAINWITYAPLGTRVEFKGAKRTLSQNDRMWAMLTDVAMQRDHFGRHYTPDEWKAIFMRACGHEIHFIPTLEGDGVIPWGLNSSDLSKDEMSELIAFMQAWGDQSGIVWHDKIEACPS